MPFPSLETVHIDCLPFFNWGQLEMQVSSSDWEEKHHLKYSDPWQLGGKRAQWDWAATKRETYGIEIAFRKSTSIPESELESQIFM